MKTRKLLAFVLAALMLASMIVVPAAAADLEYANIDFEKFTAGKALTNADGFAEVQPTQSVLTEGEGDAKNTFVRVPFWGECRTKNDFEGNVDKSIQINHEKLPTTGTFVISVDYRPHYDAAVGGAPTLELQFRKYTFTDASGVVHNNGQYFNIFTINLKTGMLNSAAGEVQPDAEGLKADQWNNIKIVFSPAEGKFNTYINGKLYAVQSSALGQYYSGGWQTCPGATNLVVEANQIILAKCNKNVDAYSKDESKMTYVDLDNIRVYSEGASEITIDGEKKSVSAGSSVDLVKAGQKLVWAKVTKADGTSYRTTEPTIVAENGMVIETHSISLSTVGGAVAREGNPMGLRFVTRLGKAEYDALKASAEVESIRIGTLIAPKLSVAAVSGEFTKENLGENAAEVIATDGKWYGTEESAYLFAGSLVNIKDAHYNSEFCARGFVEVKMKSGETYTIWSTEGKADAQTGTIAAAAKLAIESDETLNEAQKAALKVYADAFQGDLMEYYKKSMNGLNVLTLGDSLFWGTTSVDRSKQWINLLGAECKWNLTNLGVSGMTVSKTANNQSSGKASMYERLFNNADFCYGSKNSDYYTVGTPSGRAEDVDLIILEGGCNDYGTAVAAPLGTNDSKDSGTYLGAWNLITEKLLATYPNAKIIFLTTWDLAGSQDRSKGANDGMTSMEFSRSILTLYKEKYADNDRIYLIDGGNAEVSGVDMRDPVWRGTYSTDSYHLKETGFRIMADHMLPLIWQIVTGKAN